MTDPKIIRSLVTLHALATALWRDNAATARFMSTPMDAFGGKSPLLYMLDGGQSAIDDVVEWFRNLGDTGW